MVYNIVFIIGVILVTVFMVYLTKWATNKTTKYPFESWEKSDLPFITIDVQGHSLNMITDSAAAVSIIRKDVLKNLSYEPSTRVVNLSALTEDGINSEVVVIPISINGKVIKTDFLVYDSDDIACFRRHGIIIDGLFGAEFFKATKGLIDFSNQTVKFS